MSIISKDAPHYKSIAVSTKNDLQYCLHLSKFTLVGIPLGTQVDPSHHDLITDFKKTALTFSYQTASYNLISDGALEDA